jgi:hypothetical protein
MHRLCDSSAGPAAVKRSPVLREAMRQVKIAYDGAEGPDVYLIDVLAPEDVSNIDVKLQRLTEQWMNMWRKVGGIKVLSVRSR